MSEELERNLGEQPIVKVLEAHGLDRQAIVKTSPEPITHKMMARACKGRRLTKRSQHKIQAAMNAATGENFKLSDLFNY